MSQPAFKASALFPESFLLTHGSWAAPRLFPGGLRDLAGLPGVALWWPQGRLCPLSRLQTGWSVHTYQTEKQRKNQCLSPAEVEAILQVIQRAERLDVLEQQRIG